MAPVGNAKSKKEIEESLDDGIIPNTHAEKKQIPVYMAASQVEKLDGISKNDKLLDIVTVPVRPMFMKFRAPSRVFSSPFVRVHQFVEKRNEVSHSVSSSADQSLTKKTHIPLARKINWDSLLQMSKKWIRDPMNMALLAWIVCVAVSGAILFMVMTGMLNHVLRKKSQRDSWFEVNNQILNALFTLMCLYQHPRRCYYLVLLCRWNSQDVLTLRKIYCKNGTYKPNEWMHMMVVVSLLHLNCFAQYALCSLNLGYRRAERPVIGVAVTISVAFIAPAIASVYNILSPLGKEYGSETDEEAQTQIIRTDLGQPTLNKGRILEKKYSFAARGDLRADETSPQWIGGLFELWDDFSLAYLSFFCSFCVFGWNMDRLGFGNMYVHIATFLLLCLAPFWIFNLAAVNINNEVVREALGVTGIVLCVFGLLYGGFWRIQMRKKFNLPANRFCCGNAAVTDCFLWLCCCSCSLAQEARTADFYDVVEDKLYPKELIDDMEVTTSPLIKDSGMEEIISSSFNSESPKELPKANSDEAKPSKSGEEMATQGKSVILAPPIPSVIRKDDNM